ncbi:MmcQ/YjbR family DNA-binding protein [Vibrio hannami]|uniref:MmcQ/YjbR family DNA-binding protein n=1 Tax=Vibrio hannami TaxID=2717094 RepID=UPI00240F1C8C|nr:MmcQ/YjbR family DNA-binding protein [Vibrio hannami]MDG3088027.1 MmcQ/YjbR family DNA-binding protein [Vibrio hannami]
MSRSELVEYLKSFNGSEETYPFGPATLVYKVKDKMFALIGHRNGQDFVNLKANPDDVLFLIEQFTFVSPGYHMNKKHWVSVNIEYPDADEVLRGFVENSYQLVVSNLTKKQQAELSDPS